MVRQSLAMHVVTSKRRHKDREYETTLVRRSYRDGDRVRKQTLANLSYLPPEAIDAVRRVLRGETLVGAGEALQSARSGAWPTASSPAPAAAGRSAPRTDRARGSA